VQTLGTVLAKECLGETKNKKKLGHSILNYTKKTCGCWSSVDRGFTAVAVFRLPNQALEAWRQSYTKKGCA